MTISQQEGLSSELFENFFKYQMSIKNVQKQVNFALNHQNVTLTAENYEEISNQIFDEILDQLEKKCDPKYYKLTRNGSLKLTTEGLFRADAITALISELFS
jgi:hypothetical protein